MEVNATETLLLEACCCLVTWQQFLCSCRCVDHRPLVTSQGQSLESSELWCELSLCWVRCVTGIVTRKKYPWDLLVYFSICSPQETRLLWSPCGIGTGNTSILSPSVDFDQIWPRGQTEKRQPLLPYEGKLRVSLGGSPQHPQNEEGSFRQMFVPLQMAEWVSHEAHM